MPLNLIPQIFFDLIARVVPGAIFLVLIYPVLYGPQSTLNAILKFSGRDGILNIWSSFLFVIFSYITGFILGQSFTLLKKMRRKINDRSNLQAFNSCIAENNQIRTLLKQNEIKIDAQQLPPIYVMYDHLRFYSPSEAYRLLKLRAETRMCESLILSFLILFFMNSIGWLFEKEIFIPSRVIFTIILLLGFMTIWRGRKTIDMYYITGTCRLWLFYNFPFESLKTVISERVKSNP